MEFTKLTVDKEKFTLEDAKAAAHAIFQEQAAGFQQIKNEKWYNHLLNAITLHAGDKKKVIRDIRSLNRLQTLFMQIYVEQYRGLDAQLNEIIEGLGKVNRVVHDLYYACVAKLKPQENLDSLSQVEKATLIMF